MHDGKLTCLYTIMTTN